jgi:hypothetical protein
MKKILHLNLYRKYFDAIADGTKTTEYRDKTDYWKRRIEDREYDIIKFRNGYAKDAPTLSLKIHVVFSYIYACNPFGFHTINLLFL